MKTMYLSSTLKINYAFRQRGASLLEGIAYLGIAAIVILGAVSLLTSAFGGAESNRLVEEVTAIRTSVRKLYMSQSAGYGAANANLNLNVATANAFPGTLQVVRANGVPTGVVNNSWNGAVTVAVAAATNQFTIAYTAVPADVCTNAVSGSTGWAGVTINNAVLVMPATPAAAAAGCNANANAITWTAN